MPLALSPRRRLVEVMATPEPASTQGAEHRCLEGTMSVRATATRWSAGGVRVLETRPSHIRHDSRQLSGTKVPSVDGRCSVVASSAGWGRPDWHR